jgi:hypothetical protein
VAFGIPIKKKSVRFEVFARSVAFVRTEVSEEPSASFIRVTRIGESSHLVFLRSVRRLLFTASVVPTSQILITLMKEA